MSPPRQKRRNHMTKIGKLLVALVCAVALVFIIYIKVPAVQVVMDEKLPWFKAPAEKISSLLNPDAAPAPAAPPASTVSSTPQPVATPSVDLAALTPSSPEWPKSLSLKKPVEFPAVQDGKVIGKIVAPAGSEVHLIVIRNGQLGIEYKGGGAMVDPEITDVIAQVQNFRTASVPRN